MIPNLTILCKFISDGDENEFLWAWLYGCYNLIEWQGHKWGYTENMLRGELEKVGFKIIGYFTSKGGNVGCVYRGQMVSLNLECVKP